MLGSEATILKCLQNERACAVLVSLVHGHYLGQMVLQERTMFPTALLQPSLDGAWVLPGPPGGLLFPPPEQSHPWVLVARLLLPYCKKEFVPFAELSAFFGTNRSSPNNCFCPK